MKFILVFVISLLQAVYLSSRQLFETFPVTGGEYVVSTINGNISNPSGVEMGYYKGKYGCFVTSPKLQAIYFVDITTYTHALVAGTPYISGSFDGQLLHSTFEGPTRMAYDATNLRLFVTERKSGLVRVLDFVSDQTKALVSPDNSIIRFERTVQSSSIFPGLDIQISGSNLFVVDTLKLYSISSASSNLNDISNGAVVKEYTSLTDYFNMNAYPISATLRSCIYSVAPDEKRKVLYVGVSYAKNVILRVPMNIAEPYTSISVLAGDDSVTYHGNTGGYSPPTSNNGNIYDTPSSVRLAFPVHVRLVGDTSTLLFAEAYPTTDFGDFLFGSLTIRRLDIESGNVDTYCGVDFSGTNTSLYKTIGSAGGYNDGPIWSAEFAYPMTLTVLRANADNKAKSETTPFYSIVVADYSNNAVRFVAPFMDTAAPTPLPTYFQATPSPTTSSDLGAILGQDKLTSTSSAVVISIVSGCTCSCLIVWIYLIRVKRAGNRDDVSGKFADSNHNADDNDRSWATRSLVNRTTEEDTSATAYSARSSSPVGKSDRQWDRIHGLAVSVKNGVRNLLEDERMRYGIRNAYDDTWGDGELLDVSISSHSNHSAGDSHSDRKNPSSRIKPGCAILTCNF